MKTPLENLLPLKRWEEDEAKNLVATARSDLDVQEKRLEALERNFSDLRKKMKFPEKEAVTIDEIKKMNGHMEHLFGLLQHQKKAVAASITRLDEAMKILSEASKQRKTYETVDEHRREAERQVQKKKDQKGMDEHAVIRHKKSYAE